MDNKQYDVIVVGAGNGGLSAAAYLAKAGKRVLLIEKHNLPGGCATSFVRGRFEFEASLHELCSMGEENGTVRKLLNGYGLNVEWIPIDEAFTTISTEKGNEFNVFMPDGVKDFIDAMEKEVPGSRRSMETVMEFGRMITDALEWLEKYHNEPEGIHKVEMLMKWGDLMKIVPVSTDEMLRRIGVPDKARQIYESYWDYVSGKSEDMSFAVYCYMVYTYLTQMPWMPKYRSHEITEAFDEVIRKNGGEIWYNTEVARIDVKDNRARGVELKDGTYLPCKYVIANLMPNTVFGKMVDPKEVPPIEKKMIAARRIAQSCSIIYLGLDASAEELGLKGYDTFVRSSGDNAVQFAKMGSIDSVEYAATVISNAPYPEAYEKGSCVLQFALFYTDDVMKDVQVKDYFKLKDTILERTVAHFEKVTGVNVHDHIEEVVVATPETLARYLGTPGGSVYGYYPSSWDGMFARIQSGHKIDHHVKGLRMVGAHGTQLDGYSQTYLNGAEQARYALEDMQEGE